MKKTGHEYERPPQYYDLLYAIYGERPLDRPNTVSCGLAPEAQPHDDEAAAADTTPMLSADEEEGAELSLPGTSRPGKRKRIRPRSHSERMEDLHKELLKEIKNQGEKMMEFNNKALEEHTRLETRRIQVMEDHNDLLKKISGCFQN